MSPEKIVETPFNLNQSDPGITGQNTTASQWSDLFQYQVPNGVALIIKPYHTFSLSAYTQATTPAEISNSAARIKIEKRDPTGSEVLLLYGPELYVASKEFQYTIKMAHLKVPPQGIIIMERESLVIAVNFTTAIDYDHASTYFELRIAKVRRALGA